MLNEKGMRLRHCVRCHAHFKARTWRARIRKPVRWGRLAWGALVGRVHNDLVDVFSALDDMRGYPPVTRREIQAMLYALGHLTHPKGAGKMLEKAGKAIGWEDDRPERDPDTMDGRQFVRWLLSSEVGLLVMSRQMWRGHDRRTVRG
jgi:hypothetical protein